MARDVYWEYQKSLYTTDTTGPMHYCTVFGEIAIIFAEFRCSQIFNSEEDFNKKIESLVPKAFWRDLDFWLGSDGQLKRVKQLIFICPVFISSI